MLNDASDLDEAAAEFGLSQPDIDKLRVRLSRLNMSANDPGTAFLIGAGLFEKLIETVPATINAAPDQIRGAVAEALTQIPASIEHASQKAVGEVSKAAGKDLAALHEILTEDLAKTVSDKAELHFANSEKLLDQKIADVKRRTAIISAGVVVGAALLAGSIGWGAGRATAAATGSEIAVLTSTRGDGAAWVEIMSSNADLRDPLSKYCKPGSQYVSQTDAGRICAVPLKVDGVEAAVRAGGPWAAIEAAAGWSPAIILALVFAAGLLARKMIGRFGRFRIVRWLSS